MYLYVYNKIGGHSRFVYYKPDTIDFESTAPNIVGVTMFRTQGNSFANHFIFRYVIFPFFFIWGCSYRKGYFILWLISFSPIFFSHELRLLHSVEIIWKISFVDNNNNNNIYAVTLYAMCCLYVSCQMNLHFICFSHSVFFYHKLIEKWW